MTGHSVLAAAAAFLSALALAGCNDEKAPAEAIPDITYAVWGAAPDKVDVSTVEQHDRSGAVVKRIQTSMTPHIVSDCVTSADFVMVNENVVTGIKETVPGGSMTVDYRLAKGLAYDYRPMQDEAELFKDPNNKPAFTPQKFLTAHIDGVDAVCMPNTGCLSSGEPIFIFPDTKITGDSLVAAFKRVKANCPSP